MRHYQRTDTHLAGNVAHHVTKQPPATHFHRFIANRAANFLESTKVDRIFVLMHNAAHTLPWPGTNVAIQRCDSAAATSNIANSIDRVSGMASILVLHGPNLNLLGSREPDVYGHLSLADIDRQLAERALAAGHHLQILQSNAEYELIDRIHRSRDEGIDFILFNPAAFTHTSVALRDALLAVGIPFIEIHLSNVHRRETFRNVSYFSDIATGVILGFGAQSYLLAFDAAAAQLAAD